MIDTLAIKATANIYQFDAKMAWYFFLPDGKIVPVIVQTDMEWTGRWGERVGPTRSKIRESIQYVN